MSRRQRRNLACVLLGAGAALMIAGIWRGEMQVVFQKAAAICLECIGIG